MTASSVVVQPIVSHYLGLTVRSYLKKLKVEYIRPTGSSVYIISPEQAGQPWFFESMLRLNTLTLSSVTLDWAHAQFSGLVDLQLYDIEPSPSMDQICNVLIANPHLSTVELEWVHMDSHDFSVAESKSRERIKLPKLNLLNLGGKGWDFIGYLLQVIDPGINLPCLKISSFSTPAEALSSVDDLHSFFTRQKITTLSLAIPNAPLDLILPCPEGLTNLVFANQYVGDLSMIIDTIGSQDTSLRRIILRDCRVTIKGLRRIASIHSVQSLWLEHCMYAPPIYDHYFSELPEDDLSWLEETVPDLYVDYAHHERKRGSLPWWLE
ncbi:hypothetical protein BN14_02450 [Rhizoctonia solani AG-1 IB]|uniref:F-box-like domain-containing protein n=1 Tax=Thanatephorus cucumeris (strain AG1-IB / isolate 7/3/14) TaxID=1108050 RepID=M5BPV4_THACB|nr:hypothetical protein BN14_02450 [Rhizoctonia solani AG-1 IB]